MKFWGILGSKLEVHKKNMVTCNTYWSSYTCILSEKQTLSLQPFSARTCIIPIHYPVKVLKRLNKHWGENFDNCKCQIIEKC